MSNAQPKQLLIEIGNTQSVIALAEGKSLLRKWRIETGLRTSDEWRWELKQCLAEVHLLPEALKVILVSSVVRGTADGVAEALPGVSTKLFSWKSPWSFRLQVERPEAVGVDRLLNLEAARRHVEPPFVVVDFGTATTLSVMDAEGAFVGGVIAPGVTMFARSMATQASQLYEVPIELPSRVIGHHTTSALQSGIAWGTLTMVRGLVKKVQEELQAPDAKVLLTGGWARMFYEGLPEANYLPDLTLQGMLEVYESMD